MLVNIKKELLGQKITGQNHRVFLGGREIGLFDKSSKHAARWIGAEIKTWRGFYWGYVGSGPLHLAFTLLLELTSNRRFAQLHGRDFMEACVAKMQRPEFSMEINEVQEWLEVTLYG